MLEKTITILVMILGFDGGMPRLDVATTLVHAGDPATLYRTEMIEHHEQWTRLQAGTVVATDEGLAIMGLDDLDNLGEADLTTLRAVIEIPMARFSLADRASDLSPTTDPDMLDQRIAALIPQDEQVEWAVLRILQQRWQDRIGPLSMTEDPADSADSGEPGEPGDRTPDRPLLVQEPLRDEATPVSPDFGASDTPEPPSNGLMARVHAWAEAWSAQRVEDYLAFYAKGFVPSLGQNRDAWEHQRRQRIVTPQSIDVVLDDIQIRVLGPDRAEATFVQHYRSDRFTDTVRKRLELIWEGKDWCIAREEVAAP